MSRRDILGRLKASWVCPTRCDPVQKVAMTSYTDSLRSIFPSSRRKVFVASLDTGNCGNLESTR